MSTQTLVKIAIVGGPIAVGSALFFQSRIHANFRKQEFYTQTLQLMEGYPPAVEILGKPIKVRRIDLGDRRLNYTDGLQARLAIPLTGVKEKGVLHSWSSRGEVSQSWQVDKCDLEVKGQQWTFYIHPKAKGRYQATGSQDDGDSQPDLEVQSKDNAENLDYISTKS